MSEEKLIALVKSKEEFIKCYKENKPFVIHNLSESINELSEIAFLSSLEAMIDSWSEHVDVHLPDVSDEASTLEVPVGEARKYFDDGMGLLFNDVNTIEPLLSNWLDSIRSGLGLSQMTYGRSLVYVTPANKGTASHFDQNINFVLQMTGTKKWWVAPNKEIENPMTRHTMGQEIDPELESYLTGPMPETFPEGSEEFILKPGSMLFVPRGSWHKTHAETDALSLNFTYSAPTWLDILSAALRGRLAQSPEWRATADFVNDEENVEEAIEKFNSLLDQLAEDVPNWRAEDILGATEASPDMFEDGEQ